MRFDDWLLILKIVFWYTAHKWSLYGQRDEQTMKQKVAPLNKSKSAKSIPKSNYSLSCKVICKAIPLQALTGPHGSRRLRFVEFPDNRYTKLVRLSALRTGRLYPQERLLALISVTVWVDPGAIVRPGRLRHSKIPVTPIGNRTCDLPACSAVPQPTDLPRTRNCIAARLFQEFVFFLYDTMCVGLSRPNFNKENYIIPLKAIHFNFI